MRATQAYFEQTGGPEVIQWRAVDLPSPGPGQILVRQEAVGLNYIDTYFRTGLYPAPLPAGLGMEAAGVIEAVGEGVVGYKPGSRVGYFGSSLGAYASARIMNAADVIPVPANIELTTAAAILLKGATAEFLVERCAPVAAGEWAMVPAAAGGVGDLLVQWLTARGVRVIATVGSEAKAAKARASGAELVLLSGDPDLVKQVRDATDGAGVRAVYDGVGAATWESSLGSLARRGTLASFGNASGPVTGVNLGVLASHGSLFVTRPTLFDYYRDRAEAGPAVEKLWAMVGAGKLKVEIGQTYPLAEAAQAHRDLEARMTTGSTVLLP